ncbi:DUF2339 domain-containing protein, partial [Xanthomonas phaseoli]|uniref:DUF2339 domain-containing protein n=1 Tax=Xanthomonas phaseoli TaxID=1985254 RepID=UPI00052820CC
METIIVLVALVLLAVPVGVVIALVWIAGLRRRVAALEQRLAQWQGSGAGRADAPAQAPADAQGRAWERPDEAPAAGTGPGVVADSDLSGYRTSDAARQDDGWHAPGADHEAVGVSASAMPPPLPAQAPADAMARSAIAASERPGPQAQATRAQPAQPQSAQPQPPQLPAAPSAIARAASALKRWFTEGNVPVKVGMLVLLAGVASLLKYASDQGWMRMPIELRLAGISVLALAGLVIPPL